MELSAILKSMSSHPFIHPIPLLPFLKQDLHRILTEPECNLIAQQVALMHTEGVDLKFTADAIREIARVAAEVNEDVEQIGKRGKNATHQKKNIVLFHEIFNLFAPENYRCSPTAYSH